MNVHNHADGTVCGETCPLRHEGVAYPPWFRDYMVAVEARISDLEGRIDRLRRGADDMERRIRAARRDARTGKPL